MSESLLLKYDYSFFKYFMHGENGIDLVNEDISGCNNLLVTIGDSWTWGDSLTGIYDGQRVKQIRNIPNREKLIYGSHLQSYLPSYDFINIAYPGTANRWIVDVALRFIELKKVLNYENIIIVCTLTEIVRDFISNSVDFKKNTIDNYWQLVEEEFLVKLQPLDNIDGLSLIIGRNFTHTHPKNRNILKNNLSDIWIEVNRQYWNASYDEFIPFMGYITKYARFTPSISDVFYHDLSHDKKQWCLDNVFPAARIIDDFLLECPLHYKVATKHPTELSHELWAKYIMDYIKRNRIG